MSATDATPAIVPAPASLSLRALAVAAAEVGVREEGGNNRGRRVETYLAAAGGEPGMAWCASFLYFCFRAASQAAGVINPCPRTLGALRMWTLSDAICHVVTPTPGRVVVLDHGKGLGHVSIIETVNADGTITDIAGNTNQAGSRAGDSVARHTWQPDDALATRGARLVGFLDLDRAPTRSVAE